MRKALDADVGFPLAVCHRSVLLLLGLKRRIFLGPVLMREPTLYIDIPFSEATLHLSKFIMRSCACECGSRQNTVTVFFFFFNHTQRSVVERSSRPLTCGRIFKNPDGRAAHQLNRERLFLAFFVAFVDHPSCHLSIVVHLADAKIV